MVLLNHDVEVSYYKCDRCIAVVAVNKNEKILKAEIAEVNSSPPQTDAAVLAIQELTKALKLMTAYYRSTKRKPPHRRYL